MSKGSILVVDDESEIREGLELLLKTEGYQVAMADTGAVRTLAARRASVRPASARRQPP